MLSTENHKHEELTFLNCIECKILNNYLKQKLSKKKKC